MNPRRTAAVIATYRREAELARLLEGLAGSTTPPDEVIVADNAASPQTAALCQRHGAIWLPQQSNAGPGPAWNAALKQALSAPHCRQVLVLDDDVVLAPQAVEHLASALLQSGAGACAPLLYDQEERLWGFPEPVAPDLRRTIRRVHTPSECLAALGSGLHAFTWATGACMLYTRRALEQCGLFREDFWMLGEDLELSMRVAASLGGVFTATVSVPHLPPPATDPAAAKISGHLKFLSLLQNLGVLSFHVPHHAHMPRYLAGNYKRFFLTAGLSPASLREAGACFWHGAVRGRPAGTPAGVRLRERAAKRLAP